VASVVDFRVVHGYANDTQSRAAQNGKSSAANTVIALPSQYLHVTQSNNLPPAQPPLAVFSTKSAAAMKQPQNDDMYSVEKETSPLDVSVGAAAFDTDEMPADHLYANDAVGNKLRRQSRSVDNLSDYVKMSSSSGSAEAARLSFQNSAANTGEYSYARNFDLSPVLNGIVPPLSSENSSKRKLTKTSSNPTLLDANRAASAMARSRDNATSRDDYVPASPPSAAVSINSGSVFSGARVSDPVSSPTASDVASASGSQSPAVMSPAHGISMSSRSRVFTRQKSSFAKKT